MPKLWNETISEHRKSVRTSVLDAVAVLAADSGLGSVTMSSVAQEAGIGRATLYKYFPDLDAVLSAWHERQVTGHLGRLADIGKRTDSPLERLKAVLEAFAVASRHDGHELATLLHQGEHVMRAQQQLLGFVSDLLAEGADAGEIRRDVPPDELAAYCLHALTAAPRTSSPDALHRLVAITLAGLRPATS